MTSTSEPSTSELPTLKTSISEISISDHLRAVVKDETVPADALAALVTRIDEAAPPLRDVLERAARGRPLSDDDATLFFYGLHILAAGRDRRAFPVLLQFLRRPPAELEDLLGDTVTESLTRILASLFDDDVDALLAAAIDPRIDGCARDALVGAATFLTWDGRIPRERMQNFLARFEAETPPPAGDMSWIAWVQAIAVLGLRDLLPRVERVFADDLLPENVLEWRDFDQELRDAERAPADGERFASLGLGYVGDIVEALRWTERPDEAPEPPITNPHRDIGRNDPCPCGSGKKFKKCCLGKG